MKEPIKVGDLVYVAHCPCDHWYGRVFRVGEIQPNNSGYIRCETCMANHKAPRGVAISADFAPGKIYCAPLPWLKKIDPPAEQSTTDTPAELFA